jgi:hypothetical protein
MASSRSRATAHTSTGSGRTFNTAARYRFPSQRKEKLMINASQIKEHMDVVGSDGKKVGKVDHVEGADKIRLTKSDSPDGKHHLVPVGWVDHIDQQVHLNKAASDVQKNWSLAA